jgi:hypothetical protein
MSWITLYEQSTDPETPPVGYATMYVTTGGEFAFKLDDGSLRTISATYNMATGSVTHATTSSTYAVVSGMSLSLPAGTYAAWFNASASLNQTNTGSISFFINAAQVAASERTFHAESTNSGHSHDLTHIVSTIHTFTLSSSGTLDVRFKTSGGTLNMLTRTLIAHQGS